MCGIAGIYLKDPTLFDGEELTCLAIEMLAQIEHRGRHATGLAAFGAVDGAPFTKAVRGSCSATEFAKHLDPLPNGTRYVMLHTRWATQGSPAFPENNHPVQSGGVYCVHNGHITNDDDLFAATGAHRLGKVDSEAIPAAVAAQPWTTEGIVTALESLDGNFAVALGRAEQPDHLYLARGNSSPLITIEHDQFLLWGSTLSTVEKAWSMMFGSKPALSRSKTHREGDLIEIKDATVTRSTFKPIPGWEPNPSYSAPSKPATGWAGNYGSSGAWVNSGKGWQRYDADLDADLPTDDRQRIGIPEEDWDTEFKAAFDLWEKTADNAKRLGPAKPGEVLRGSTWTQYPHDAEAKQQWTFYWSKSDAAKSAATIAAQQTTAIERVDHDHYGSDDLWKDIEAEADYDCDSCAEPVATTDPLHLYGDQWVCESCFKATQTWGATVREQIRAITAADAADDDPDPTTESRWSARRRFKLANRG